MELCNYYSYLYSINGKERWLLIAACIKSFCNRRSWRARVYVWMRTKDNRERNRWHSRWRDSSGPNNHMWRLADDSEVGRRLLYIKGERQGTRDRQTNKRWTTNKRRTSDKQTRDRRIEGASQRCVPKSGRRVSTGEATESIGLSIKVVSVWNRIKSLVTCCSINLVSKTHSFNIQHHGMTS